MENPFLLRAVLAIGIILAGLGIYRLFNRFVMRRNGGRVRDLGSRAPGVFALVYFTTPTCAPCKTIQRPAIERLKAELGERLEVFEIDASQQPDVAKRWGVLSVPTTFVVDSSDSVRFVNHGVTPLEKLRQQFLGNLKPG